MRALQIGTVGIALAVPSVVGAHPIHRRHHHCEDSERVLGPRTCGRFGDWSYVTRMPSITLGWLVQARSLAPPASDTQSSATLVCEQSPLVPDAMKTVGPGVRITVGVAPSFYVGTEMSGGVTAGWLGGYGAILGVFGGQHRIDRTTVRARARRRCAVRGFIASRQRLASGSRSPAARRSLDLAVVDARRLRRARSVCSRPQRGSAVRVPLPRLRWRSVVMKSIVLLVLASALATGCDRDERRRGPTANDEVPTPVERPDATAGEDWCKEHGVPESRCAPCLARRGSGWSLGAGTCGVVTTTCEDPALGTGVLAPELTTAKPSEDRGSPTRRRSRTRAGSHP